MELLLVSLNLTAITDNLGNKNKSSTIYRNQTWCHNFYPKYIGLSIMKIKYFYTLT